MVPSTARSGASLTRTWPAVRVVGVTRPAVRVAAGGGPAPPSPPAPSQPDPPSSSSSSVLSRLDPAAGMAAPPPLRVLRPPPPGTKKPLEPHFWGKVSVLALAVRSLFSERERDQKNTHTPLHCRRLLSRTPPSPTLSLSLPLVQSVLISERVTGSGAVQALDLEVGVPLWEIDIPVALLVGGCLLAGLTPPPAAKLKGVKPAALARGFLYRLAFLGLAAVLVCEVATGKGALSFLELETGVGEVGEVEAFTLFVGLLFLVGDYGDADDAAGGGGGGAPGGGGVGRV